MGKKRESGVLRDHERQNLSARKLDLRARNNVCCKKEKVR